MEIRVYNKSLIAIDVIDIVDSFIWTERYQTVGDFEIVSRVTKTNLTLMQPGNYIKIPDSDRTMIVETVRVTTDHENGDRIIVSGRTAESILNRRIVLRQIQLDGTLQDGIAALLDENVIDGCWARV